MLFSKERINSKFITRQWGLTLGVNVIAQKTTFWKGKEIRCLVGHWRKYLSGFFHQVNIPAKIIQYEKKKKRVYLISGAGPTEDPTCKKTNLDPYHIQTQKPTQSGSQT